MTLLHLNHNGAEEGIWRGITNTQGLKLYEK